MQAIRHGASIVAALAAAATLLVVPGSAYGYSTAPGLAAADYATGFAQSAANHWGPLGIAFDQSDNLYVDDPVDGSIYRFQPGGGAVSAATRLNRTPIPGALTGLAITGGGGLYLARYSPGDVVQIDPGTGAIVRTVAGVPCATGLAVDPISGDLFVSQNQCGSTIYRVSLAGPGAPTATPYAIAPGVDGLAFDQSGTLYAESDGTVIEVAGTNSAFPGRVSAIARVPHSDGLAFGAHASGGVPYLVTNGNDGVVTKVDFTQSPPSQQPIFTGGSRGDFAAVDADGCLYITQSSSIVRISSAGSQCAFEPTTPGSGAPPVPALVVTQLTAASSARKPGSSGQARGCARTRTLTLRLSQRGRVRLRSATVYVNGHRVAQLKGSAVGAPFVLSRLPGSSFSLVVVAITSKGKRLVTRRSYGSLCPVKPPACLARSTVKLGVPQRRGTRATSVVVYVNAHRRAVVRGRSLRSVNVSVVPNRFVVKLVVHYASGVTKSYQRSFLGCAQARKKGAVRPGGRRAARPPGRPVARR